MAGMDKDFKGEAWAAKGAKVGYLPQEPHSTRVDVRGNVMLGVAEAGQAGPLQRTGDELLGRDRRRNGRACRTRSTPKTCGIWTARSTSRWRPCAARPMMPMSTTPVGRRTPPRRAVQAAARSADMLLLDEPTNHLDAETIAWLQKHLIEYKGTILIVTHDRYFLDDITGWILELDRGRGIPYEGNYSAWLDQKAKRLAQEAREDKAKQKGAGKGTGVDPLRCQGPSGQGQGPPQPPITKWPARPSRERATTAQIIIPNGERWATR
jgi:ATPase subunit of ABC transporter with duplicated ATPase domains